MVIAATMTRNGFMAETNLRRLLRPRDGARAFPPPLAANPASFGDSPARQMRQAIDGGSAAALRARRFGEPQKLLDFSERRGKASPSFDPENPGVRNNRGIMP